MMNKEKNGGFKNPVKDRKKFEHWVQLLEIQNRRQYSRIDLPTALGNTRVYGLNLEKDYKETLVVFPGARTTALIWDLDKGLDNLNLDMKIYLVETNGLPNLSDAYTHDIRGLDYGHWANDVLKLLGIERAHIAGASYGGLIAMKLALADSSRIKSVFFLNPGCLQPFSLGLKNLYYNLLPIAFPYKRYIRQFLDKAIFHKPVHRLNRVSENMLVNYESFALRRYVDRTQKPYAMREELNAVNVDVYLLLGSKDLLFPYDKSIKNAKKYMSCIKKIKVFDNVGHGIETYAAAMHFIGETIKYGTHEE